MLTREQAAPNDLAAFWMPFTANRQFKAEPRLFVARRGHALHDDRRAQGARRHRRPLVLQRRALPARRSRGDPRAGGRARLRARPSRWATRRPSSWPTQLVGIAPEGLDHVFFTNSGSESVDTALKIALAYQRAIGQGTRTRLIGRERGYHGVNFGGISVGGIGQQPQVLRHAAGRRRPSAAHARPRAERASAAASPSTAPSSPTSSSGSWRCTTPRPSRR